MEPESLSPHSQELAVYACPELLSFTYTVLVCDAWCSSGSVMKGKANKNFNLWHCGISHSSRLIKLITEIEPSKHLSERE